ncbi:large conductance mechanosensitive channel [Nocardioides thalensis]|uniref:Large conductance mechanosensitive channel n=1 Tax=Nocardioides thalensis TaxID=1914755 RepID=A0A853BX42_9ACTN|nr:MscL family protein [Nocardioides thalensis]NYI99778.1 large conductance mechanosensitive channel [Nocardioides thalensis]
MEGFKNFILRGNLIEIAVGLIMALAFAEVVNAFVAWLTSLLPDDLYNDLFGESLFGLFLNAVVAFLIMAAVVYFFVVVPYTKAKERFFPDEAPGPSEVELLTQIRDSLANR